MIALGILLSVAAIGFFCWLLFTLAVYALPFFAVMTVGLWVYDSGARAIGSFLTGAFAAGLTFGLGQRLFHSVRPVRLRFALALEFAAPPAFAGSPDMLAL